MTSEEFKILEHNIKVLVQELHYLMHIIANSYKIVKAIEDNDLQRHYAKETLPTIKDFDEVLHVLRPLLDQKFTYERQNNIPIDIKYRKLYQNLFKN